MNLPGPQKADDPGSRRETPPRTILSSDLFGGGEARCIIIRHNDRDYVLRVTRQGKLLLNIRN